MPIEDIPRQDWKRFCAAFSTQHRGWLVSVETVDPAAAPADAAQQELAAETLAYDRVSEPAPEERATATLQLKNIMHDAALKTIELTRIPAGGEQLVLSAEARDGRLLTHAILSPLRLRLESTDSGADQALYVDTQSHTIILRFPVTAPMEALDGIVSE